MILGSWRIWPYVILWRNSCILAKCHYLIITQKDMTDGKKIGGQESVITTLLTGSHYAGEELFASLCVKTLTWTTLVWLAPGELWKKHTERQKDVRGQLKGKIRLSLTQKAGLSISPHYICVLCVRDGEQNTFWACAMALLICYIHLHLRRDTDTINILMNAFIFLMSLCSLQWCVCFDVKLRYSHT